MIPDGRHPPRVLVVDDERANLHLLSIALRNEGYLVDTASDGESALEVAWNFTPDLILLDIVMPGIDGFETIRRLKEIEGTSTTPVIFLTGMEDLESKLKGFALGAVDYITKPFHLEEVRARVRLHLQLALAQKSLIQEQANRLKSLAKAQRTLQLKSSDLPDANFAVWYESAQEAGGDLYDVLDLGSGIYGFLVADVSGHDVGTSLVATAAKALFRQNSGPMYSPEETFQLANQVLTGWLPPGRFLTACYALLNRNTGQLKMVGAAHPPAVILDTRGNARFLDVEGDVLGAFPEARFGRLDCRVKKGDRVVLYTDGLVESMLSGRSYASGGADLLEALRLSHDLPLEDLPRHLADRLAGNSREDDILTLAFEV
jgi:phosphoserine phosphatase RsbU/P